MICNRCGREMRAIYTSSPADDYYGGMHGRMDTRVTYECICHKYGVGKINVKGRLITKVEWDCPSCGLVNVTNPSKPNTKCECGFKVDYVDYSFKKQER